MSERLSIRETISERKAACDIGGRAVANCVECPAAIGCPILALKQRAEEVSTPVAASGGSETGNLDGGVIGSMTARRQEKMPPAEMLTRPTKQEEQAKLNAAIRARQIAKEQRDKAQRIQAAQEETRRVYAEQEVWAAQEAMRQRRAAQLAQAQAAQKRAQASQAPKEKSYLEELFSDASFVIARSLRSKAKSSDFDLVP